MENKKITKIELAIILKEHQKWLNTRFSDKIKGKRANLTNADLTNADLTGANLTWAKLTNADLTGAKLTGAKLTWANLTNADLTGADLTEADLTEANLREAKLTWAKLTKADLTEAKLTGAKLTWANLTKADLTRADLTEADLTGADLTEANLTNADLTEAENIRKGLILKESMIVFKSIKLSNNKNTIATLEIPTGAIVFSINNSKCRTNKAKVLKIEGVEDNMIAYSQHDYNFKYEVGKEIEIEDFSLIYNIECASGIHFFRTKEEAVNY